MSLQVIERKLRSAARRMRLAATRVALGIRGEIDVTPSEIFALLLPAADKDRRAAFTSQLDPDQRVLLERIAAPSPEKVSSHTKAVSLLVGPHQRLGSAKRQARALARKGFDVSVVRLRLGRGQAKSRDLGTNVHLHEVRIEALKPITPLSFFSHDAVELIAAHRPFAVQTSHVTTAPVALEAARRTGAKVVVDIPARGYGDCRAIKGADIRPALAKSFRSALREMTLLAVRRAALVTPLVSGDRSEDSLLEEVLRGIPNRSVQGYGDAYDELWSTRNSGTHRLARSRTLRVLHAPCNIGNQPWGLSRAEREIGLQSELVVNHTSSFDYPADRVLGEIGQGGANALLARLIPAIAAPYDHDVVHYYFGRSLLDWSDLPMQPTEEASDLKQARASGKTVIMTLQGCDARMAAKSNSQNLHTPCAAGRCHLFETCVHAIDQARRKMIETVLPHCDQVFFLNPELGHFVPNGVFMPYASVDVWSATPRMRSMTRRPRVVHAPTDRGIKGTDFILAALESLSERYAFELVLVEGKTHEEAMAIYKSADIAIDQIFSGWYGGFAVEMMAMGVPVMCYLRKEDFVHLPNGFVDDLPVINISPDRLVQDIEAVLRRQDEWPELARASRAFVEKWHDPMRIAAWMKSIYLNPKQRASHFTPDLPPTIVAP
jgi:hypothetical protein